MKKIYMCVVLIISAILVSCSKDSDEIKSTNLSISDDSISLSYNKNGTIGITSNNGNNCSISVDNSFIAECNIVGNNININAKHKGITTAKLNCGSLSKSITIKIKGTTENLCGAPILMIGESYNTILDSVKRIKGVVLQPVIHQHKNINYTLKNELGDILNYTYFFQNDKLLVIVVSAADYPSSSFAKYQTEMLETYDFISNNQIDKDISHSIYKYKDDTYIISCQRLTTSNGRSYITPVMDISNDISILNNTTYFYNTGYPRYF